jgi:hypothetical protein
VIISDLQRSEAPLRRYNIEDLHSEKTGIGLLERIPDLGEESLSLHIARSHRATVFGSNRTQVPMRNDESGLPLPA